MVSEAGRQPAPGQRPRIFEAGNFRLERSSPAEKQKFRFSEKWFIDPHGSNKITGVSIQSDDGNFLKARDGRKFPVSGSGSAIRDDDNINSGWDTIFCDAPVSVRVEDEGQGFPKCQHVDSAA
jgi:hypothetical protein